MIIQVYETGTKSNLNFKHLEIIISNTLNDHWSWKLEICIFLKYIILYIVFHSFWFTISTADSGLSVCQAPVFSAGGQAFFWRDVTRPCFQATSHMAQVKVTPTGQSSIVPWLHPRTPYGSWLNLWFRSQFIINLSNQNILNHAGIAVLAVPRMLYFQFAGRKGRCFWMLLISFDGIGKCISGLGDMWLFASIYFPFCSFGSWKVCSMIVMTVRSSTDGVLLSRQMTRFQRRWWVSSASAKSPDFNWELFRHIFSANMCQYDVEITIPTSGRWWHPAMQHLGGPAANCRAAWKVMAKLRLHTKFRDVCWHNSWTKTPKVFFFFSSIFVDVVVLVHGTCFTLAAWAIPRFDRSTIPWKQQGLVDSKRTIKEMRSQRRLPWGLQFATLNNC